MTNVFDQTATAIKDTVNDYMTDLIMAAGSWLDRWTEALRTSDTKFNVLGAMTDKVASSVTNLSRRIESPSPSPSEGKVKSTPSPDRSQHIERPDIEQSRPDVAAMVKSTGLSCLADIQGLDLGQSASVGETGMDGQLVGCMAQVSPVMRQQHQQSMSLSLSRR